MLRLGIIGCGRVTSMFHLRAIEQVDAIKVSAVSDIDEARMLETQKESGAEKAYLSCDELFDDPDIDAVAVNTPPRFHESLILDALRHGKHVLCEKPLAETVSGCNTILATQNGTGLRVLPGHNYVFTPSLERMTEILSLGKLGEVQGINVFFENNLRLYGSETDFRENRKTGVLEDVLPHILSVVQPIAGHVSGVDDVAWWCKDYDVCDNMTLKMRAGDIPVDASLSWTKLRPRFSLSVECENGELGGDLMMNPFKLNVTKDGRRETINMNGLGWYIDLIKFRHPSFRNQYLHFNQLVNGEVAPKISIMDEINILETITEVSEKMELD